MTGPAGLSSTSHSYNSSHKPYFNLVSPSAHLSQLFHQQNISPQSSRTSTPLAQSNISQSQPSLSHTCPKHSSSMLATSIFWLFNFSRAPVQQNIVNTSQQHPAISHAQNNPIKSLPHKFYRRISASYTKLYQLQSNLQSVLLSEIPENESSTGRSGSWKAETKPKESQETVKLRVKGREMQVVREKMEMKENQNQATNAKINQKIDRKDPILIQPEGIISSHETDCWNCWMVARLDWYVDTGFLAVHWFSTTWDVAITDSSYCWYKY